MKNSNLILSNVEYLVIELMINNSPPIYGLDLVKQSKGALKRGTIYVTLNRMESKGYLSSIKEEQRLGHKGQPRRLYTLNAQGQRAFELTRMIKNYGDDYAFS